MSVKDKIKNYIIKHFFELSQISVDEINDGLTSSDSTVALCRKLAAEGCVLVKNEGVLPIKREDSIAVFGRCQINYFYVGYGSGGDVKPPYLVSPMNAFADAQVNVDEEIAKLYRQWCEKNPPDDGSWGNWPTCYPEMPISKEIVEAASKRNDTAIVIIGRSAGEDREIKRIPGSWYLTKKEEQLLEYTKKYFKKVCVVLNCGSIFDTSWIEKYSIDAVLFSWQGGQESGNGLVDILTGKVSPSGKLTDTVADVEQYPSTATFGDKNKSIYSEDIYVGYRYFETFKREAVRYPFGFGLSYTQFDIETKLVSTLMNSATFDIRVKNVGNYSGKEVVQIYLKKPQGKLGASARELISFVKSNELQPGEEEYYNIEVSLLDFASYDDTGVTGNINAYILEAGDYDFYVGTDVRSAKLIGSIKLDEIVVKKTEELCPPQTAFERIVNQNGQVNYEAVPLGTRDLRERILKRIPEPLECKQKIEFSFSDVRDGKISLEDFVATLSENDLETLSRGSLHGMNSSYGPCGNAGVFGGTSPELLARHVPLLSTNDGPSGCRLQAHSTLFPIGSVLASSFNLELIEKTICKLGQETIIRRSHVLLAPGMNIHRNPLCGRNFEYFSEDPYLTGKIAIAYVKGVQSSGCSAVIKHFCCNNQETGRNINDSIVSQRALREIYVKAFERCITEANPDCIMTSYNKINGEYSYYSYDLCMMMLREEFGFGGVIMTDWWIKDGCSKEFSNLTTQAYRVRAGNNVYMPGALMSGRKKYQSDGTLLKSLHAEDGVTLGELQKNALYVLRFALKHM